MKKQEKIEDLPALLKRLRTIPGARALDSAAGGRFTTGRDALAGALRVRRDLGATS